MASSGYKRVLPRFTPACFSEAFMAPTNSLGISGSKCAARLLRGRRIHCRSDIVRRVLRGIIPKGQAYYICCRRFWAKKTIAKASTFTYPNMAFKRWRLGTCKKPSSMPQESTWIGFLISGFTAVANPFTR